MAGRSHPGLEREAAAAMSLSLASMEGVLGVSALTERLRACLEDHFPFVWVRGEAGRVSRPASGHLYFCLKDERAQLECVWYSASQKRASSQKFNPITGEVYESAPPGARDMIADGVEILCGGPLNIYAPRGRYQLQVEYALPAGAGQLALAFENLKSRLEAKGFFAQARKRPIPLNPGRVALITSPRGAAIHDFLEIGGKRGLSSRIRLFPSPVQGEGAASKIAAAIALANSQGWAEVIVLIRGGGSLEDLWCFNEERVAEAVFASAIPVLAGIGHEIDYTLADMTADARAATPSHAAQLLWSPRQELWQRLDSLAISLDDSLSGKLARLEERLAGKIDALRWLSPLRTLERMEQKLLSLEAALAGKPDRLLERKYEAWRRLAARGAAARALTDRARSARERLPWLEKALFQAWSRFFETGNASLARLEQGLEQNMERALAAKTERLQNLEMSLSALNPLAPLKRGYAILTDEKGLIKSVNDCRPGSRLTGRLQDGELDLAVRAMKKYGGDANEMP